MNKILNRLFIRAKKLAVLLLLIPILTAGAGYFFASQKPVNFTASSKIAMGNFENQKHTNPNYMKDYVTTTGFLEKVNEKYKLNLNVPQVKSRFTTNANQQANTLELGYSGQNKSEVEETLGKLTDVIIAEGTELFEKKKKTFRDGLSGIQGQETEYEKVYKEVQNLEYSIKELDTVNSEIVEDVSVKNSQVISPLNSAILGFLVGLIVNSFILFLPELFREEKN